MTKKKGEGEPRKKLGRPTGYTKALGLEICMVIGTTSKGLDRLCEEFEHWPHAATLYNWQDKHPDFFENYRRAKMRQAEFMVEELTSIADDGRNDYYEDEDGNDKARTEHIQRSKLRIDTRKWIACKVLPKVYGDKTQVDANINAKVANLTASVTDPVEASRIYQQIMQTDPT